MNNVIKVFIMNVVMSKDHTWRFHNLDAPSLRKEIPPQMNFPRRGCLGRLTGETHICIGPEARCAEGPLRQGVKHLAGGRVRGGKRVYLSVSKASPNQLDYLGVESPFSRKGGLMWELIGCTIELVWDINGAKRPQMLLTPKEEIVGELGHATGV